MTTTLKDINDYIDSINEATRKHWGYDLFPNLKTTDKIVNFVHTTKDLDKFKEWDINRDITNRALNDKKKSIEEHGMLMPAIIKEGNVIGEGNHRHRAMKALKAEKGLDLDFSYIISSDLTDLQIKVMNNNNNKWGAKGNGQHLRRAENPEFLRLFALEEKYHLKADEAFSMLVSTSYVSGDKRKKVFEGKDNLNLTELQWANLEKFIAHVVELRNYTFMDNTEIKALFPVFAAESYNEEKMVGKVKRQYEKTNQKIRAIGTGVVNKREWFLEYYNKGLRENLITKITQGNKTILK